MYTKLWAWNMDEYKSVIFLDTDMIVKGSLRNLFELMEINSNHKSKPPFEFAATGDIWAESFDTLFNAGFFVVRPNKETFEDFMTNKGKNLKYNGGIAMFLIDIDLAEQNFLNAYYKMSRVQLPYNYGMSIKSKLK